MTISDGSLYELLNPVSALLAGMVTSLHCVGMCGPLSCALIGQKADSKREWSPYLFYHGGRFVSYVGLGAIVGAIGGYLIDWLGANPGKYLPWAMALFFLFMALGWDARIARWQAKTGFGRSVVKTAYSFSGNKRGGALGLVTPLIPCGPLYLMLWAASLAGSWQGGVIAMAAFAIGTMPLALLAQGGWSWLASRSSVQTMSRLRRGVALVAMAALCLRGVMDVGLESLLNGEAFCN